MDERPDSALVMDTLAGDRDAFAALVRRYQDHVYGLAVGRACDFELARDVVKEAFASAYRDLPTLQKPSRFAGWLRGIVRNTSFRTFREMQRIRMLAAELAEHGPAPPAPRTADETDAVRVTVRLALESLNDKNREVFGLFYAGGLTSAEVAEFLGASEASVQGRLQRTGEELQEVLPVLEQALEDAGPPADLVGEVNELIDAGSAEAEPRARGAGDEGAGAAAPAGPLGEALGDPRELVRRVAAHALCVTDDPYALRSVVRLPEARTLEAAAEQIGMILSIPGVRDSLLAALDAGRKIDRIYALAAVFHLGDDEEVYDRLLGIFREPEEDARVARLALSVLCALRPGDAPALVSEGLSSPHGQVRGGAAWEAVSRGLQPALEHCRGCLGPGTSWWGRKFAGHLILQHGEDGERVLEELLESGDPAERLTAALVLAQAGSDAGFSALKEGLLGGKSKRGWRRAITHAAGGQYPEELEGWLEEEGRAVAALPSALWTLAQGSVPQPTPILEALADEGEPAARAAALRILALAKGADAIPLLRDCLREGRPRKVAQEAFRRMLELGDDAAPAAREMLASEHWTERKAAVGLLRRWGLLTEDERAAAVEDPHVAVRHAAGLWPPPGA